MLRFSIHHVFQNSLVISLIASVTAVVIGISGAYALSNYASKLARKSMLAFTPFMFSGILIVVPLFKIISGLGLYDTNTALIITMVVQTLPTAIFMLKVILTRFRLILKKQQ